MENEGRQFNPAQEKPLKGRQSSLSHENLLPLRSFSELQNLRRGTIICSAIVGTVGNEGVAIWQYILTTRKFASSQGIHLSYRTSRDVSA